MLGGSTEGKVFAYTSHWDLFNFNIDRKTAIAVEVGAGSAVTVSELQNQ